MSWDAHLTDDGGDNEGSWNYTHNTNRMIAAALKDQDGSATPDVGGPLAGVIGPAWWYRLDGTTGPDGRDYLALIISGLEAHPDRYRAMNPANGWGSYDSLLIVLREMRDAVPDWPTTWRVSG